MLPPMALFSAIAVAAVLLLVALAGSLRGAAGGAMTIAVLMLVVAAAVGVREAWRSRRGPLGWIVSLVVALLGGFVALTLAGGVIELLLDSFGGGGSLMGGGGLALQGALSALALAAISGAGVALRLIGRWRA